MQTKYHFILVLLFIMISSCFKEEDPIELPQVADDSVITTIEMGKDYSSQFFFDLSSGTTVSSNSKTAWDLAFDCRKDKFFIWLNYSKTMFVANTFSKDFNINVDLANLEWQIDASSGHPDSNAIGIWGDFEIDNPVSIGWVYILDLGKDENNVALGFRKMQILDFSNDQYKIRIAGLDGSEEGVIAIDKDPLRNFRYVSFKEGQTVDIEPVKTDWDLLFTRYTKLFYSPVFTPYQVTGVLINPNHVEVAEVTDMAFEEIKITDTGEFDSGSNWDIIGYNWKEVDINTGSYTVLSDRIYVIKDNRDTYYKLRFLDFTNDSGENGFPEIEYRKI